MNPKPDTEELKRVREELENANKTIEHLTKAYKVLRDRLGSFGNPTHWMPLPEEPEKDRPTNSSPKPNTEESDLALIRRAMGVMFQGWMIHMQTNPECTGKGPPGRPCEPIEQCWCKNEITQHIEIAKRRERHER